MHKIVGWDIGGAHVKAVLLDENKKVIHVQQMACPLWLGLDELKTAMLAMLKSIQVESQQVRHAVTMTGELVDLFANRHEGVLAIAQFVSQLLGNEILFYAIDSKSNTPHFVTINQVSEHTKMIASANWHASACLIAQRLPSALLVDIGSTTTDIIAIENGKVINRALTDAERMQQDVLVYTGVVRTPVMAVAQKLPLEFGETNVAAEYFATMADVYRLTGELSETVDMAETADGGPKTISASARRLARMVGHDVEDKPLESWQQLAQACRVKQCHQIQSAINKQLTNNMTILGAGAGHFLVKAIAQSLQQPYATLNSIWPHQHERLGVCLPAYAVAVLASEKGIV
jgi:(4-(4-[2-(gamma-L-glutamylamino)ethyl]phenoxymethyl)furan-2-yl)methanamine synthase